MNKNNLNIFVVNLISSKNRRKHMENLCSEYGLTLIFIEAVDGKDLSEVELLTCCDRNKAISDFGKELMPGEIGCALSHKKIYKKMVDDNIETALILEDDVAFGQLFKEVLSFIHRFPSNWELVLLGYHAGYENGQEINSPISFWHKTRLNSNLSLGRLVGYGFGTYGYLLNNNGAKKLLDELTKIHKPIDHYTSDDKLVNVYVISPTVISAEKSFDTLIDGENNRNIQEFYGWKKILKKTGLFDLVKWLYYFLRRLKPIKPFS